MSRPVDGGWGWVVVAASFLCNLVVDGLIYTFGVQLGVLAAHYECEVGSVAWVGSLLAGCPMLAGPLVGCLVTKFGCRAVCVLGAVLSCSALLLSTLAPTVLSLALLYGVVGGTGLGLIYLPAILSVGLHFHRRRSLATGISVCGSGVGAFVFAPMTNFLLETHGWQTSNMVFGGLCLLCALCGATMRPTHRAKTGDMKKARSSSREPEEGRQTGQGRSEEDLNSPAISVSPAAPALMISPAFFLICLSNMFGYVGIIIPFHFLPSLAGQVVTGQEAALLLSITGISNTAGRVAAGWLADLPMVEPLSVVTAALLSGAACLATLPFLTTFTQLAVLSLLFGFSVAAFIAPTSSVLVDLLGVERLTTGFGLVTMFRGAASVAGPPLAGALFHSTHSYSSCFWLAAGCLLAAGLTSAAAALAGCKQAAIGPAALAPQK